MRSRSTTSTPKSSMHRHSRGSSPPRGIRRASTRAPTADILAIGSLFGVGAGEGSTGGQRARYVFAERGSVHVVSSSDCRRADGVHDRGEREQPARARGVAGTGDNAIAQRAGARRSRATWRSVVHQSRRVHRQGEPDVRPGARRPRSRRARQLARRVRTQRHAEHARALRTVRDTRPLFRVGRKLGGRSSMADAGE